MPPSDTLLPPSHHTTSVLWGRGGLDLLGAIPRQPSGPSPPLPSQWVLLFFPKQGSVWEGGGARGAVPLCCECSTCGTSVFLVHQDGGGRGVVKPAVPFCQLRSCGELGVPTGQQPVKAFVCLLPPPSLQLWHLRSRFGFFLKLASHQLTLMSSYPLLSSHHVAENSCFSPTRFFPCSELELLLPTTSPFLARVRLSPAGCEWEGWVVFLRVS